MAAARREEMRCAHLRLTHALRCVYGQLLEGVDGDEDGSHARVNLIARISHAQIVEQGGRRQLGELDHIRRTAQRERVRVDDARYIFRRQRARG